MCHNFDMELSKERLGAFARAAGFDDIRFARADGLPESGGLLPPSALLQSAACVVVLFMAYRPTTAPEPGYMALSPYYVASHRAYHAARTVAEYIKERGAGALHTTAVSAKSAARAAGGFLGDNGFYYHPKLGSLVCIQTVLTGAFEPQPYAADGDCLHCGACAAACPSRAVGRMGDCLRVHLNGPVPEALRGDVYQLLGCERCQSACPLNAGETGEPYSVALAALLTGGATQALRELAGPNMARRSRLVSQGALYAASMRQTQLIPILKQLAENEAEPVRTHARWALEQIGGGEK